MQNTSRIQPVLTTFIAIPLAWENACLVSLLPLMPTLVCPQLSSQSDRLKRQDTPCCSSAQKPTMAPIFIKCKIQNPTSASRAIHNLFPHSLSDHISHFHVCFRCSSCPGLCCSGHTPRGFLLQRLHIVRCLLPGMHPLLSPLISLISVFTYCLPNNTYLDHPI